MSSVESIISEIDSNYKKMVEMASELMKKRQVTEEDALNLFGSMLRFQRMLEYNRENLEIFKDRPFFNRMEGKYKEIISSLANEKRDDANRVYGDDYGYINVSGIVYNSRRVVEFFKKRKYASVGVLLYRISEDLDELKLDLMEFYEDLRLISSLTIFPIEEKMKLKNELVANGFNQIVEYLEIAEQHFASTPPRLKDVLSNCRHSVESMITKSLEKIGGKPTQRFSIDLGTLAGSQYNFLDRETKDVVLSIWSYLSMKGSHSYRKIDQKAMSDVEFGLDQTYRILSQILSKHQSYSKTKKE